jgi:hypothetical protein
MAAWYGARNCEFHTRDARLPPGRDEDTVRIARQIPHSRADGGDTGGMRIVQYVVIALLGVGLVVTSIGWYLSAHPGGVRFESCHWQGEDLVLGYTYGSGDTVRTLVNPQSDDVMAQLRVDEGGGDHTTQVLQGEARFSIAGGPRPVHYPNGAELNCPSR